MKRLNLMMQWKTSSIFCDTGPVLLFRVCSWQSKASFNPYFKNQGIDDAIIPRTLRHQRDISCLAS
jgi:hypothetical protein